MTAELHGTHLKRSKKGSYRGKSGAGSDWCGDCGGRGHYFIWEKPHEMGGWVYARYPCELCMGMGRVPKSAQFYNGLAVVHDGRNINDVIKELEREGHLNYEADRDCIDDGPHIGDVDHEVGTGVLGAYDDSADPVSEGAPESE